MQAHVQRRQRAAQGRRGVLARRAFQVDQHDGGAHGRRQARQRGLDAVGVLARLRPALGTRFGVGTDANYFLTGNTGSPSEGYPVTFQQILALTPSTAYWFDVLVANNGSNTAVMQKITVSLVELAQ